MDGKPRIVINGRDHEIPPLDSFTMGEAMILYEYTGQTLDQLGDEHLHPGLVAALLHVAYQRANPDMPKARVREAVESVNLLEALEQLAPEDDESPPAVAPPPAENEKPATSGGASSTAPSEHPQENGQSPTGSQPSETPTLGLVSVHRTSTG